MLTGCLTADFYEPGVYEGMARGYRGNIVVRVFVSDIGIINNIEILEHGEDDFSVSVLEELIELALEMNSYDLDAVSGATVTNKGFISAMETALGK